jgi:hypothetical protein
MTAATITNAQSVLVVRFNQTAETVKGNVAEMKQDAVQLRDAAVNEAKEQGRRAVLSLSMILPLIVLLVVALAFTPFGIGALVRMLPMGGLMLATYVVMNLLNPAHRQ